jgi:hypothetical protein
METDKKWKLRRGRTKHERFPVGLFMHRKQFEAMRERAEAEGMAFANWLKWIAVRELRRPLK